MNGINGSWDAYLASPVDFAGADDIITNLAKEREPGDIKRTPQSLLTKLVLDCSQSPYFSVGFSRPVCFDGTAAILVCKSERDLGRVSKLPRGGEWSLEAAGKIGRL